MTTRPVGMWITRYRGWRNFKIWGRRAAKMSTYCHVRRKEASRWRVVTINIHRTHLSYFHVSRTSNITRARLLICIENEGNPVGRRYLCARARPLPLIPLGYVSRARVGTPVKTPYRLFIVSHPVISLLRRSLLLLLSLFGIRRGHVSRLSKRAPRVSPKVLLQTTLPNFSSLSFFFSLSLYLSLPLSLSVSTPLKRYENYHAQKLYAFNVLTRV